MGGSGSEASIDGTRLGGGSSDDLEQAVQAAKELGCLTASTSAPLEALVEYLVRER